MNDEVLYIVIPAYNEEANIESVVRSWYPVIEAHSGGGKSRLLVVNDGSTDNTKDILESLASELSMLIAITKENGGHGATVMFGYRLALEAGADYVFQTDSDGQTLPSEFEMFWHYRVKNDMVIGYRMHRKDGLGRLITTRVLRLTIRVFLGVRVLDANTPYRLMKADMLKENLCYVPDGFFLSNVLLSAIYIKRQEPVLFLPVTFRPRQGGVNSINLRKIFRIGLDSVKAFREFRPVLDTLETKGDYMQI